MSPATSPAKHWVALSAMVLSGLFGATIPVAQAGPAKSVRATTYPELAEGQAQGVLLTSLGDVRPGFSSNRMALPSLSDDSVRAIAVSREGGIYLGTGGERASVLSYRSGAALQKLATLDASTWITALIPLDGPPGAAKAGALLAATAQDGRIFRIGEDGSATVVAQLDAEHIWGLARDAARGVTYVATSPGRLWAIEDRDMATQATPTAGKDKAAAPALTKARKLFESDARQFLALHRGGDGSLYVGTADDAVLYRVDPAGRAQAIHDFAGNEVRAIASVGGVLYVAVNDMQRGDTANRPTPTKIVTPAAGTVPGVKPTPPAGSTPPATSPTEKKGKGALFRIDESGRVEQLHAIVDGFFNALTVDANGHVYAAASLPGGRGKLFWVTPDRTVITAHEVKESDLLVVALPPTAGPSAVPARTSDGGPAPGAAGLLVGTGNAGAFYLLRDTPPADASYVSKVFAAPAPSRWGRLRYLGRGALRVETRSGNLAKPDGSWGPWLPLEGVTTQPSTDEQVGRIASAAARYLQVRVAVPDRAVLHDFSFTHQPVNTRPRVLEVTVGEDASGRFARGVKPANATRPRTPIIKIRWKVENPDEDDLSYRVYVRPLSVRTTVNKGAAAATGAVPSAGGDGPGWVRLGGPDPILRAELEWNTEALPDGLYEMKVVASDERSNPPELALTHEHTTPPFAIDNRRPEIRDLVWNAGSGVLTGRAIDATSPLSEISYSIDGGELYPIAARDGVIDDLSEDFAVRPSRLTPGAHTLVIRVSDGADNVGSAQIVVLVGAPPGPGPSPGPSPSPNPSSGQP